MCEIWSCVQCFNIVFVWIQRRHMMVTRHNDRIIFEVCTDSPKQTTKKINIYILPFWQREPGSEMKYFVKWKSSISICQTRLVELGYKIKIIVLWSLSEKILKMQIVFTLQYIQTWQKQSELSCYLILAACGWKNLQNSVSSETWLEWVWSRFDLFARIIFCLLHPFKILEACIKTWKLFSTFLWLLDVYKWSEKPELDILIDRGNLWL